MNSVLKIILLGLFFLPIVGKGQTVCSDQSRHRLDSILQKLESSDLQQKPINEIVVKLGKTFLGIPYVEKTLEMPGDEPLVINMTGLDCTTYLETIVTLSRLTKMGKFTFGDYEKELEFQRYRDGNRDHYPSRLHYFSDWIYESEKKGIAKDITKSIGGVKYENHTGFMSSNSKYYPQLSNVDYVEEITNAEKKIAKRKYYYIPKESVEEAETQIQPGDLLAMTIDMDNLDIAHVGFAVQQNGRIHLMHASSSGKRVMISEKPLSEYLMGIKKQTGIMVCRLISP